jgi:dihydroneopterin aldolase
MLKDTGFLGLMIEMSEDSASQSLLHEKLPKLRELVSDARRHGLLVGLSGTFEAPDIPRLLALEPDFLGGTPLDPAKMKIARALIPRRRSSVGAKLDPPPGREYASEPMSTKPSLDRVYVRDLVLPVRIGAYVYEKEAPQRVRFNITVEVESGGRQTRTMADVFSYDLIIDTIEAIIAEEHIEFVESLAERVSGELLRHHHARRVTVSVEKLDVGPGAVGVEIVREREAGR